MTSLIHKLEEPPCTLQHLKDRCQVDDECWVWKAAYRQRRWPTIAFRRDWLGDGERANKVFYVRHLMYWLTKGTPAALGKFWAMVPSCGNPQCVNPDHLKIVSRKHLAKKNSAAGRYNSLARRLKLAETKRKTSKLSDEAVAEIRLPESKPKEMAAKHGISVAYAYMLRNGEWRKDYRANPFAALL